MSYIIVSEYLCDCIGHVNRVSWKEEKVGRKVEREEKGGKEGKESMEFSIIRAKEIKIV